MGRKPYVLRQAKRKTGKVWSVSFYNQDTEKYNSAIVVSKVRVMLGGKWEQDTSSINKYLASRICEEAVKKGLNTQGKAQSVKASITFEEYFLNFWDFDTSPYIAEMNLGTATGEEKIKRDYANCMKNKFKNHIKNNIPTNIKLNRLKPYHLQNVKDTMIKKQLNADTINKVIISMKKPLYRAYETGLIFNNPSSLLKSVRLNGSKETGILTSEESKDLMKALQTLYSKGTFEDGKYYSIIIGMLTGMRLSEIRALSVNDIIINEEEKTASMLVSHSLDSKAQLKLPKADKQRDVSIPLQLAKNLIILGNNNPTGSNIIWTKQKTTGKSNFISSNYVRDSFLLLVA